MSAASDHPALPLVVTMQRVVNQGGAARLRHLLMRRVDEFPMAAAVEASPAWARDFITGLPLLVREYLRPTGAVHPLTNHEQMLKALDRAASLALSIINMKRHELARLAELEESGDMELFP